MVTFFLDLSDKHNTIVNLLGFIKVILSLALLKAI